MSKLSPTADYEDIDQDRKPSRLLSFLPYLLILIFTLVGVAYTSINKKPLIQYWEDPRNCHGGLVCLSRVAAHPQQSRTGPARLDAGSSLGCFSGGHEFAARFGRSKDAEL